MKKDIKDYREKELHAYTIGNILIILLGTGLLDAIILRVSNSWDIVNTLLSSAVFSSLIYIYVFLADSVIPSKIKDCIVWPKSSMPGHHIFTDIRDKKRDLRFTQEEAIEKYNAVFERIDAVSCSKAKKDIQNSEWNNIYRKHEKKAQIYVAQRDYLLCRDMNTMTILLIIGFFALVVYYRQAFSWGTLAILVAEFVITWLTARSKGNRFAYNVIATDLKKLTKNDQKTEMPEEGTYQISFKRVK